MNEWIYLNYVDSFKIDLVQSCLFKSSEYHLNSRHISKSEFEYDSLQLRMLSIRICQII